MFPLKGLATTGPAAWDSTPAYQAAIDDQGPRLSWFYDYAQTPGGTVPSGVQYVPMLPRLTSVTQPNIDAAVASAGANGYIMVCNEGDGQGEDVNQWITKWEIIATDSGVISNNIKLIAPSAINTDGPNGTSAWLATFMAGITHQPYALSVHKYNPSASNIIAALDAHHKTYAGFPIWLTEFGPSGSPTDAAAEAFMQDVVQSLRVVRRAERFAWFFLGPEGYVSEVGSNVGLYNADGSARPIAAKWKSLAPGGVRL